MVRRFVKVSEEEIEEAFFDPSDLVNTKTTIPLRVGEERWIYIYPPLFTSPSGNSCIISMFYPKLIVVPFQSWSKFQKCLFRLKRHILVVQLPYPHWLIPK